MPFPPRLAWSLAIGCALWQLPARAGQLLDNMIYLGSWSPLAAIVGLTAITGLVAAQVLGTLGRASRWLLAAMAVLTFAPAPMVGAAWPMVGGLLGAAILLTVRAPVSWLLFTLAAIADAVIGWSLSDEGAVILTSRLFVTASVGFTLYAVTRLARLIQEADDTRIEAVRVEAKAERLRSARRLRLEMGSRLSHLLGLARSTAAAGAPARADVAEIARIARQAANEARRVVAIDEPARDDETPSHPRATSADDFRLAWAVSILIAVIFAGIAVINVIWEGGASAATWAAVIATAAVTGLLHLYHGTPRADGGSPRWWPWTLSAHILVLLVAVTLVGPSLFVLVILAIGSAFTRLRSPWSWWCLLVLGIAYLAMSYVALSTWSGWTAVYFAGALAIGVITVYSLCNLPGVARQLRETRDELARTAVVTERLRLARDVHDLLGFHLSAIAVQADVAAASLDTEPEVAREHLHEVRRSAEKALAEVRAIDEVADEITVGAELAAARSMLEAAGVHVVTARPPLLPAEVDQVAGIIIREATTNVVRHSRATHCTIGVALDNGGLRLTVTNDGAIAPTCGRPGTGIASLTARAETVGGQLTTVLRDGTFTLTALLPAGMRSAYRTGAMGNAVGASSTT